MPSAWLGNDKYQILSHFGSTMVRSPEVQTPQSFKTGDRRSTYSVGVGVGVGVGEGGDNEGEVVRASLRFFRWFTDGIKCYWKKTRWNKVL